MVQSAVSCISVNVCAVCNTANSGCDGGESFLLWLSRLQMLPLQMDSFQVPTHWQHLLGSAGCGEKSRNWISGTLLERVAATVDAVLTLCAHFFRLVDSTTVSSVSHGNGTLLWKRLLWCVESN